MTCDDQRQVTVITSGLIYLTMFGNHLQNGQSD